MVFLCWCAVKKLLTQSFHKCQKRVRWCRSLVRRCSAGHQLLKLQEDCGHRASVSCDVFVYLSAFTRRQDIVTVVVIVRWWWWWWWWWWRQHCNASHMNSTSNQIRYDRMISSPRIFNHCLYKNILTMACCLVVDLVYMEDQLMLVVNEWTHIPEF